MTNSLTSMSLRDALEKIIDYRGKSVPKSESGVLLITAKNVKEGVLDFSETEFISAADYDTWMSRGMPRSGDIIFTTEAPLGNVAPFPESGKFALGQRIIVLRPKTGVLDSNYLLQFLLSPVGKKKLNIRATGSTAQGIKSSEFKKVTIEIPYINEQQEIGRLLKVWDTAIEKTEKLIEAKEKRFSWLIKSLISNQCGHWEHLHVEKIFQSISEKNNGDEELLSVTQDREVIPRTMLEGRVMSPEGSTDSYKLVKKGDFVISLRSFQGGIEYSRYQGLISPAYTVLRQNLKIHDEFYRHFFKSYLFIEKYLNIAVIGIRDGKQISIPDFMTVKIPYPPLKQQKQIAETLNTARQEIDLLKKIVDAYRKQKRGLMQKLLTGEWRVKGE